MKKMIEKAGATMGRAMECVGRNAFSLATGVAVGISCAGMANAAMSTGRRAIVNAQNPECTVLLKRSFGRTKETTMHWNDQVPKNLIKVTNVNSAFVGKTADKVQSTIINGVFIGTTAGTSYMVSNKLKGGREIEAEILFEEEIC